MFIERMDKQLSFTIGKNYDTSLAMSTGGRYNQRSYLKVLTAFLAGGCTYILVEMDKQQLNSMEA